MLRITTAERRELSEKYRSHYHEGNPVELDVVEGHDGNGRMVLYQPGDFVSFPSAGTGTQLQGEIGLLIEMIAPESVRKGVYAIVLVGDHPHQRRQLRVPIANIRHCSTD